MRVYRRLLPMLLVALALAATAAAAQPTNLLISEYVEGSSYNKALEIYNPTASAIDLSAGGYAVQIFFNGNTSAGQTISLVGTIAAGGTHVLSHTSAAAGILAVADQTSSGLTFNGDDAIVLVQGTTVIDSIGQVGSDPGTQWGSGDASTADNTLRRMATVCAGDTSTGDAFDPATEWDGFAVDTFDGLGSHSASCGTGGGGVSDLLISEYVEGSSNNKAIEIYNGTASAIDLGLGGYTVQLFFNGSTSAGQTIALTGTIPSGGVHVLAHSSASATILAVASQTSSSLTFNGDDAVALVKGTTVLDVIGQIGTDPGTQWGTGNASTADNTLRRMGTLCSGDPDGSDAFDPATEWDGFAVDTFDGLGSHTAACSAAGSLDELLISEYIEGSSNNKAVEIYNGTGAAVDLAAGGYQLEIYFNGNTTPSSVIALSGSLADGDVFVVAHSSASATVLAQADLTTGSLTFNGDDAIVLRQGGSSGPVADSLGQVGVDPGTEWGTGVASTANNTLRRQTGVCAGDTEPADAFDPATEWDGFAQDTFDDLGSYTTTCSGGGTGTPSLLEVFEIQGNGLASPYAGQTVTTEANVVTALAADGFFIQTPDSRADADVETSNGIFVFTASTPTVSVGDLVDVTGVVQEFFDSTQLTGSPTITVTATGQSLPAAIALGASNPSPVAPQPATAFERYEGMRVSISNGAVSGPHQRFSTDPIAEVHIVAGPTRAYREPGIEYPGISGLPVWDGNPEVFELDPDRLGLANTVIPAGSSFSATGIIGYEFGGYELWPTQLSVTPAPLPVAVGARNTGEMTIGSLNCYRLFDDVNDGGETVVSSAEYARRLTKFSLYIRQVLDAPEVLATQEVEKLGVLQDLAAQIHADDSSLTYSAYLVEGNDVGGIDVGFLVRDTVTVNAVTQLGASELHSFDNALLHDRPPLLLEASYTGNGADFDFEVLVVHARSLGGIDDPVDGPRVRSKRLEQAQSIAQMVQTEQTADPNVRLVVVGDFNAYEFTDGYVDVVGQIKGDFVPADNLLSGSDLVSPNLTDQVLSLPAADRYSFNFGGSSQVLDHALTSQGFSAFVRGMAYGRGNSDAAVDLINDDTTAARSSDHDGLVLYVMTDYDGDGLPDDVDPCPTVSGSSC